MKLTPYKPKQGRYARYSVGAGAVVLLLFAAWRVVRLLGGDVFTVMGMNVPYGVIWGGVIFVVFGGVALLFLSGCPLGFQSVDTATSAFVDLLIDTENELQKVSWPGRDELRRYTMVVIACIFILGGLVYSVDMIVSYTMSSLRVLPI